MFRISYQALAIGIVAIIGFIFAMRIITPEDNWICQNGEWIKHGQPTSPPPTTICQP